MAKHLSETYGDRAFSVAKLASLTGKRWPIVGKRLHEEFPYIDAEVRVVYINYLNFFLLIIGLYQFRFVTLFESTLALPLT